MQKRKQNPDIDIDLLLLNVSSRVWVTHNSNTSQKISSFVSEKLKTIKRKNKAKNCFWGLYPNVGVIMEICIRKTVTLIRSIDN